MFNKEKLIDNIYEPITIFTLTNILIFEYIGFAILDPLKNMWV
jgi:hypothetical protein